MSPAASKTKGPSCNVVTALRSRQYRTKKFTGKPNAILAFAEQCAAVMCTDNRKIDLPARTRSTFMTAFSPDRSLIASCHGDHNIHVTDLKSEKLVKSLVGHDRSPWCISFHPSSNDILATGCLNGEVRVWDLRGGGSESWVAPNDNVTIASLSFHPTDQVLLIAGGNEIYFWDWSFSRPFASIKTSNVHEKVRLVRFDKWGSHILTGVVNDEEQTSGEEDTEESDAIDWGWPPPRPSNSSHTRRRQMLRDWLAGTHSSSSNRTPSMSRTSSAAYNLRRRETRADAPPRARPFETFTMTPYTSSSTIPFNTVETGQQINSASRQSQAVADDNRETPPHTYSRDHERILHARVSVNAEIQHQYNRLQVLRQERRRLELRLQQLRDRGGNNTSQTNQRVLQPVVPQQTSPPRPSARSVRSVRRLTRRMRTHTSSMQEQLLDSLNDSGVEMSVNFSNPTTSVSASTIMANAARVVLSGRTNTYPVGMMNEPLEEPEEYSNFAPNYILPVALNFTPLNAPLPSNPYRHTQPFGYSPAAEHSVSAGASDPAPDPVYSRSAQQRSRARQSRNHWRRHQRRLRSINQYLSLYPGHHSPDPTSYRLQWWDFTQLDLPEISRSDLNVIVPQCKIYNDSSVDISQDGTKLAAFVPAETNFPDSMQVAIFSLEPSTLGDIIFQKQIGPNAVCLSLSPLGGYVAVGIKNRVYSQEGRQLYRFPMAQIIKIGHKGCEALSSVVHHVNHPIIPDTPQRFVNINTIAWMPGVGRGLVYGTNNGELRVCRTTSSHTTAVV